MRRGVWRENRSRNIHWLLLFPRGPISRVCPVGSDYEEEAFCSPELRAGAQTVFKFLPEKNNNENRLWKRM